jgi:hypothetical protein
MPALVDGGYAAHQDRKTPAKIFSKKQFLRNSVVNNIPSGAMISALRRIQQAQTRRQYAKSGNRGGFAQHSRELTGD